MPISRCHARDADAGQYRLFLERTEMEDTLRVGVITSSHGVRGEVKVFPTTDDLHRFSKLKSCIAAARKGTQLLHPERVRYQKGMAIIKFEEFSSIEDTLPFKGCDLLITRDQALPLAEGEYYICDLIGLTVYTDEDRLLGEIVDVIQTGANDVYAIRRADGKGEVLIPVIKESRIHVDLEAGRADVHVMDGLMDD